MTDHDHSTCQSLLGSLSDYVDGTLGEEICQVIRAHMEGCEHCRVVVDTLTKTVYLYHGLEPDPELPDAVHQRLFNVLNLDDFLSSSQA